LDNAHIPNAAPQAVYSGKVRSFWAILGLSIITCGIYYIVYNFMVASELKRATVWREDESFKPSTYMLLFVAYVGLSYVFPMFFIFAFGAKLFMTVAANPGNAEAAINSMSGSYQMAFQAFMLLVSGVGYYVAYYFLKLNDIAAAKVGAKPLGIRAAFTVYSVLFAVTILNSLMEIAVLAFDLNPVLNKNFSDLENMSASSWAPLILLGLLGLGLGLLIIATALYYLWKQTELVNHVWEAGRFAAPAGGQGYYSDSPPPSSTPPPAPETQYPKTENRAEYGPPPTHPPPQRPAAPPRPPESPDGESV
jgi:hypothetical protein